MTLINGNEKYIMSRHESTWPFGREARGVITGNFETLTGVTMEYKPRLNRYRLTQVCELKEFISNHSRV